MQGGEVSRAIPRGRVFACFLALVFFLLPASLAQATGQIPVNTTPPSISGTPKPGETLTASPGAWSGEPTEFRYRWERCNEAGSSCSWVYEREGDTHVVAPTEVGKTIRVQVTAVNEAGTSEPSLSAPVTVETAWKFVAGPPKVEIASWSIGPLRKSDPQVKGKTLTISVSSGFCDGEPPPVIDHISVVERPKTAERPFKSAVITAFVRFPAPTEVVGTVNKGEPVPGCAGLGYNLRRRIKLKRPVARLFIYDGNHSLRKLILRPQKKVGPKA
jgi:hypothetical protein